jgi:hypothetical protein
MRVFVRVLFVLALLLNATSAFAQFDGDGVDNKDGLSDGCGATMNVDQCMWGDGADSTASGQYYYCAASGSFGGTCIAAMTDNSTGIVYCQRVSRSAKCQCDDVTHKVSGTCTYQK